MPKQIGDPGSLGGASIVLPQFASMRMRTADLELVFASGLLAVASPEQRRVTIAPGFSGEAQGDMAARGAAGWQRLAAGTAGQLLRSGGAGVDAAWATIPRSYCFLAPATPSAWAVPLLLTEFLGLSVARTKADLSGATRARLTVRVVTAGLAGSELRAQYSTDESAWAYLDGASGPAASLTAAGTIASAWVSLAAGAAADVFLRLVGINGNALATPTLGLVALEIA